MYYNAVIRIIKMIIRIIVIMAIIIRKMEICNGYNIPVVVLSWTFLFKYDSQSR